MTAARRGSAGTLIPRPARSPARARPGFATAWSSPPPGISTSIRSSPTANTSATPTSGWPAPPMPARRGFGGTRSRGRRGGTPVTKWRLIPRCPGKIWGAFSDVHDIPNDNIISERHGHQRSRRDLPLTQLRRVVEQRDGRAPAQAGDFHRARSQESEERAHALRRRV